MTAYGVKVTSQDDARAVTIAFDTEVAAASRCRDAPVPTDTLTRTLTMRDGAPGEPGHLRTVLAVDRDALTPGRADATRWLPAA